jgi:hypothetical protein
MLTQKAFENICNNELKTVFVSGHVDITKQQFLKHYIPLIDKAKEQGYRFITGNANGADKMTFEYLSGYKCYNKPIKTFEYGSNEYKKWLEKHGYPGLEIIYFERNKSGKFKSHNERDTWMTMNSDYDIAWVRPENETKILYGKNYDPKRISGTMKNIKRRLKLNKK